MDFLNGRIRPLYFKYLAAAFGSALITSIYSIVDMAMVGQYQGPEGTAALCEEYGIVAKAARHGCFGGCRAYLEYHLQPGAVDGNRRLGSLCDHPGKRGGTVKEIQRVFYGFHCWGSVPGHHHMDRDRIF